MAFVKDLMTSGHAFFGLEGKVGISETFVRHKAGGGIW